MVAARSRYQFEHPNCKAEELVIYTTTQTHSLGSKAGLVLGLQVRALEVRAEYLYSLKGETLRSALVEDEKLGRKPFIISTVSVFIHVHVFLPIKVATIGTTSSGAIDNLPEIKNVCKHHLRLLR